MSLVNLNHLKLKLYAQNRRWKVTYYLTVSHDDTTKKEAEVGLNFTEEIPSDGGWSSWNSFGTSAILKKVRALGTSMHCGRFHFSSQWIWQITPLFAIFMNSNLLGMNFTVVQIALYLILDLRSIVDIFIVHTIDQGLFVEFSISETTAIWFWLIPWSICFYLSR